MVAAEAAEAAAENHPRPAAAAGQRTSTRALRRGALQAITTTATVHRYTVRPPGRPTIWLQ